MEKEKIIITCGAFDPLSIEEINLLQHCKNRGDWLIVGLYSDLWTSTLPGNQKQKFGIRREILRNVRCVDEIFTFDDANGTACHLLKLVKLCYPNALITFVSTVDMQGKPESKIAGIKFEKVTIEEK